MYRQLIFNFAHQYYDSNTEKYGILLMLNGPHYFLENVFEAAVLMEARKYEPTK